MPSSPLFFCVLGQQRSGTTLIQELLATRQDTVVFPYEFWGANFFGSFLGQWVGYTKGYDYSRAILQGLLADAAVASGNDSASVLGIKANFNSYDDAKAISAGIEAGFRWIKYIVVRRADHIAKMGSHARARKTRVWHSWNNREESNSQSNPIIDLQMSPANKMHLASCILADREISRLGEKVQDLLVVSYENDILPGPRAAMEKIESFLGLERQDYDFDRFKKLSPSPEEYISNYQEWIELQDAYSSLDSRALEEICAQLSTRSGLERLPKRVLVRAANLFNRLRD